jgi:hypothetical protein
MKSDQWKPRLDILIEYIGDEEVEGVVLDIFDLKKWRKAQEQGQNISFKNWSDQYDDIKHRTLDWETAIPFINDCDCFYVWTKTKVFFIGGYDGTTWITDVPRHPIDCIPYIVEG